MSYLPASRGLNCFNILVEFGQFDLDLSLLVGEGDLGSSGPSNVENTKHVDEVGSNDCGLNGKSNIR